MQLPTKRETEKEENIYLDQKQTKELRNAIFTILFIFGCGFVLGLLFATMYLMR